MSKNHSVHVVTGHERDRIKGRDNVYGSHRSCFSDHKFYGTAFTERQQRIIDGEKVDGLRRLDVSVVINKAEAFGLYDIAEKVYSNYGYFFHEVHPDDPSYEEALSILDSLTPDDLK